MTKYFKRFYEKPSRKSYLAVRTALIASEKYNPYSHELDSLTELLAAGKYSEAKKRIPETIPNMLLSPRAHFLFSIIAIKNDNMEAAERERYLAKICLKGILSTGNGTWEKPYLVVRTSDEHDLLEQLDKELKQQSLIEDGDRFLDCMECQCGTEMYFDITDAISRLSQQMDEE